MPSPPDPNLPEKQLLKYVESFSPTEPLFKTLIEMLPVGLSLSVSGRILAYANKAYAEIVGYTQEELEGIDWSELTYEEDRASNLEIFEKLLKREVASFEYEKRYKHKKGHLVWCKVKVTLIEDSKTGAKMTLAMVEDISQEKQLSEELGRQKAIIQMGEKVAGLGTFIWNMETQEVDASPELLRIYELDPSTTTKENLFERTMRLVHPEDVEGLRKDVMRSISDRELIQSEFRILLKEGRIKWLKSVPGAFLSDQHMLRTVQDITEEVKRRNLLESQTEMIQMGEEVSSIGTFIWDVETRELEVSQGIFQIFGLELPIDKNKVSFELFFDFIFPEDIHKVVGMLNTVSETNKGESVEFRIKTPKGQVKWIKSYEGKFLDKRRRLATIQDVTLNVEKARLLKRQKEMIEMGEGIAGFGTFVWNIKTREVIISPGLYLILGIEYKGEERKESMNSFFSMIHLEDVDKVHNALQLVTDKKETQAFLFRIYTAQGELKWVKAHKGKFLSVHERLSSIEDVTEDVKKTQLLERQKEMIEIGEKISGLGTFIWNVETREIDVSSGLFHLAGLEDNGGLSPKELLVKLISMAHPEDADALRANMDVIAEKKVLSPIEFRIITASGEVKWLRTSPGRFLSETEKLGTLLDVTEEKRRIEKIERQSRTIRVGELTARVGTFVWDIHSREIQASPGFYKCYELEPQAGDEHSLFDRAWAKVHPDDLEKMTERHKSISAGELEESTDFRIVLSNGETRWLRNYPGEFIRESLKR
ncbi:MAG: PAS domain-containing protein [Bacteroidota bacterium]